MRTYCTSLFCFQPPYPTGLFTIYEPQYQEIGEFFIVQERRKTDFEALKLWKRSVG